MRPERRTRLFRAACDEFARHGFSQASLNRIIGAVGMSKSSFYHYFRDKADLFRQTLSDALAPVVALQRRIDIDALERDNLWPTVEAALTDGFQVVQSHPEIITAGRMFYRSREDREGAALTAEFLGATSDWITRLIHRGQRLGMFRDDLPEELLLDLLMAMGVSMDRWMLIHWEELGPEQRMRLGLAGFDIARRILAPPGES